jgi:hypothetical protein
MEMFRLTRIARHWRSGVVLLLGCALLACGELGFAQEGKKDGRSEEQARPGFAEADAVRMLDDFRQALESNRSSRFLKLFDARRMPGYAVFRDEVGEFFATYIAVRVNYHVGQVGRDGEFGAVLAKITLEATPKDATPSIRRDTQARLVLVWDGKAWKIADLAPRNLFRSAP